MNYARIDLHLHLDGSLNIGWAYRKALQRKVIPENESFEVFYDRLFRNNTAHSALSITKFDLVCDLLQDYDDLYEATYDLCRRLNDLGLIYAEIRFASQQHCKKGMTQSEVPKAVIDAAEDGMNDFSIKVGIINCLMHKGDSVSFNYEENLESIKAGEQYYGRGVCGFDLAGFENNCPYADYAPLFEIVRNKGMHFTLHAAEMGEGSHILDALAMRPDRIGHGINCIQDERYIEALKEADIPLEVCVSSNIKNTRNYASHPIRYMLERGLKVTINTDNMIFAQSDLANEYRQLSMIGVSDELLEKCMYNSLDAAFCSDELKSELKKRL